MKKVVFLTGTRADFGKMKSLITKVEESDNLQAYIFVTGMHMLAKYGMTANEVEKSAFTSIYKYINQNESDSMDSILAKTIHGLSDYIKELKPEMIVVHGDRVEAMAGAVVGALNNILVAHIEGGEVSGTIDELIRHSVSKLAHLHLVCNETAKQRLIQLGENEQTISIIGSPDLDVMTSDKLPSIQEVKKHYRIDFNKYSVFMYHPVTTELDALPYRIKESVDAMLESEKNYVVIFPNNDHGSEIIIKELSRLKCEKRFRVFPSIRFESFLTLLKHSQFILGNSSAGVREMPFYGLPSINLGNRQNNRAKAGSIYNVPESKERIVSCISELPDSNYHIVKEFGEGDSDKKFIALLNEPSTWATSKQKVFVDFSS